MESSIHIQANQFRWSHFLPIPWTDFSKTIDLPFQVHSSLVKYRVTAIYFPEWQEDEGLNENRGDGLQGEGLGHTGAIVRMYDGQCQASQSCEMTKEQTRMRMPVLKQSGDAKRRRAVAISVLRLPPHSPPHVLAAVGSQSWSCAVLFLCCHPTHQLHRAKRSWRVQPWCWASPFTCPPFSCRVALVV